MLVRACTLLLVTGCLSSPEPATGRDAAPADATTIYDSDPMGLDAAAGTDGSFDAVATANTHAARFMSSLDRYLFYSDEGSSAVDVTQTVTFEAWFKLASLPTDGNQYALVVKADVNNPLTTSYSFELRNASGTMQLVARLHGAPAGGGSDVDVGGFYWPGLATGSWHHVAASYDVAGGTVADRFRFYRDGDPVPGGDVVDLASGDPITAIRDSTADMHLGVRVTGGTIGNRFDGLLDDVRLWDVVRSAGDIAAHYMVELAGDEPGLIGYWQLDDDASDSGPNAADLGIIGGFDSVTDTPF